MTWLDAALQTSPPAQTLFRTAQHLAGATVPVLADASSVDVLEQVVHGEVPPPGPVDGSRPFRRAAFATTRGGAARGAYAVGEVSHVPGATPFRQSLSDLRPRLIRRLDPDSRWLAHDPRRARVIRAAGTHSLMVLPLTVRGVVLGLFVLYRRTGSHPFDEENLREAVRLADHAAHSLEAVRRRVEEEALARLLHRSRLPDRFPPLSALEAAHGQCPPDPSVGHWYDVLPLSSARVALVVGTAAGTGVGAAVSMHQLRAVITTLSALDLRPDELLRQLDDVVVRMTACDPPPVSRPDGRPRPGTTCLYVVYDPGAGRCVSARAGDPSVVIAHPDGSVLTPHLAPHAPLGTDDQPFETTEFEAPPGSTLLLRGGVTHAAGTADDPTTERLREAMTGPAPSLPRLARQILRGRPPNRKPPVLLTRTRALRPEDVATLSLPAEPTAVSTARAWSGRQLETWSLDDLACDTALVVSELVTNAIRYSDGPVGLRLIRGERVLICEVSDTNGSGPHRRRPSSTDEGGRGLSIVTQLTRHQGTRYTASGKIVWTEQTLPDAS